MKVESFKYLYPYFNINENWGDVKQVKWWHIKHLYDIRSEMYYQHNWPMVIHCSYETTGHSKNSYHYKGMATDFHFVTDTPFRRQYEILVWYLQKLKLLDLIGLGTYPEWNEPGFHIDGRGYPLQWIRKNGKYYYSEEKVIDIL